MRLSLCMIVRDEAYFIEECLTSARPHVDEIVVVDTGSVDGTREIVERLADVALDFTWIDNFSAARNYGLAAATGDWILVLDADERIAAHDYAQLRQAMAQEGCDGYYLQNRSYTNTQLRGWRAVVSDDEQARGYGGFISHPIMKLFRAQADIRYEGRVHEIVDGTLAPDARGSLDVVIHHYGDANPGRPRKERALRYLALMDEELSEREDGRLFAIAGSTAMYFAEDYAKAQRYLRRAAQLGHDVSVSTEGAAEAAYRGGDIGTARSLYDQLYSTGHRSPALCLNLANLLVRVGEKDRAVMLLEECLQLGGIDEGVNGAIRRNIALLQGG